jgi:SAM-dependent methyltransferase
MKINPINKQTNINCDYSGIEELFDAEQGLEFYNKDIAKKILKGLGLLERSNDRSLIVEFGAGTGALADVMEQNHGLKPICVEIDMKLTEILKSKGFETYTDISLIPSLVNSVYTSNVLEHIDNDVDALVSIKKKMLPGALLVIYVPALPFLFSEMDAKVSHYRRYTKKELLGKVSQAGFSVKECYYNDCLGVLAWGSLKLFGYKGKSGIGSKKSLVIYDRVIYPVSKLLDFLFMKKLFGKNLLLVASN